MTGSLAVHLLHAQPAFVAGDIGIIDAGSSGCLVVKQPGQTRTETSLVKHSL
jgi:hypothetical protein